MSGGVRAVFSTKGHALGRQWPALQQCFHSTAMSQKEFTLPAKRLVFEDLSAASSAEMAEKDEKIKKLQGEVLELKNRVLTSLADVENMRTRMKKTAEEDKKFAVRSFAKGQFSASLPVSMSVNSDILTRTHAQR